MIQTQMQPNLSPIIKAVGETCNLRCGYCFYNGNQGQNLQIMDLNILEIIIKKLIEVSPRAVRFIWHGGEPMLAGIDFYQKVIDLQNTYKLDGQNIHNALQTNGTLINSEWAEFFKENNFGVGVSLDGPSFIQNKTRPTASGRGSFDKVMRGVNLLRDKKIRVNAIAVITKFSVNYPEEVFKFFYDEGICFSASQCTADENDLISNKELAVDPFEYSRFLLKLLDLWLDTGNSKFRIEPIADFVHAIMGQEPRSCVFNGNCEKFITVDVNGDLYPCDQYRNFAYLWGNLKSSDYYSIVKGDTYKTYSENRLRTLHACGDCKWKVVCHGWCRKTWGTNYIEDLKQHPNCRAIKVLFESTSKRLEELGYTTVL